MSEASEQVVENLRAEFVERQERAKRMAQDIASLLKNPDFKHQMNSTAEGMEPVVGEYQHSGQVHEVRFGKSGVEVRTSSVVNGKQVESFQRYTTWGDGQDLIPTLSDEQRALGHSPKLEDDLANLPPVSEDNLRKIKETYAKPKA